MQKCPICEQEFIPRTTRQKYCSRACNVRNAHIAYRERERAKKSAVKQDASHLPALPPRATNTRQDNPLPMPNAAASEPTQGHIDAAAWLASGLLYERETAKALRKERNQTIIVGGHGAAMKTANDALLVKEGVTHHPQVPVTHTLYRGQHDVQKIILLSHSGYITVQAMAWCKDEDICILVLSEDGSTLSSVTPDRCPDILLRRAQYTVTPEDKAELACAILEKKLAGQLETLRSSGLPNAQAACLVLHDLLSWLRMEQKPIWLREINRLRLLEAQAARAYFAAWQGLPLTWEKKAEKRVYPHWKMVRNRLSPVGRADSARHAVDPANAILNYAYACLEGQCRHALLAAGFDVAVGILHADKEGRDSLVYDLMECFRPQVDAACLSFLRSITFKAGDVTPVADGSCRLHPQFARCVVARCHLAQDTIDQGARWLREMLLSTPKTAPYAAAM